MEKKTKHLHLSVEGGSLLEDDISALTPVSGVPWQQALETLDLRQDELLGLRVLEVGAGSSTLMKRLLDSGIDAYAIDPAYRSRADLKGRIRAYINTHEHFTREDKQRRLAELEEFIESMKQNPQRYIRAMAGSIPFPDATFDRVISLTAISAYLNWDRKVYLQAVNECLRVTKPGGQIIFSPFLYDPAKFGSELNTIRETNDQVLLRTLHGDPRVASVQTPRIKSSDTTRLVISMSPVAK